LLVGSRDLDVAGCGAINEDGLAVGVEEALLIEVILLGIVILIAS
jgi:hypothetical protein